MTDLAFSTLAQYVLGCYDGRDRMFGARVRFWIQYFGDRDITSIDAADVEDGLDALVRRGKVKAFPRKQEDGTYVVTWEQTGKELAPATVNRHLASLGSVFKVLAQKRRLPRGFKSPARGVTRMREGNGRTVTVTVDDVRRLVACARLSRNRKLAAMIAMGCTTGLRLSSLRALRWADINLAERYADVDRTKNGTPTRSRFPQWVADELARMKPGLAQPGDLVFDEKDFRKSWLNALADANLPLDWTFHHTRHIAASILAQSGAALPVIMQALNHKTPNMALRYSHVNTKALDAAILGAWK